jgi:hypothetical protein
MKRSAPEAGNKRFVELTGRMGTYITEPGLTHIVDSASCEIVRFTRDGRVNGRGREKGRRSGRGSPRSLGWLRGYLMWVIVRYTRGSPRAVRWWVRIVRITSNVRVIRVVRVIRIIGVVKR